MRIEITNLNVKELLSFVKNYPNGVVTAENDRAYWEFDLHEKPVQKSVKQEPQVTQPVKPQQSKDSVAKMRDYLFSSFGA